MKKQNSVEWLAQQLYEQMEMKGNGNQFQDILDAANAKHKDETLTFTADWYIQWESGNKKGITELYNDTFGGNNE